MLKSHHFSSMLTIPCFWKNHDWSYLVSHQHYGLKMMRCYSDWLYNQWGITTIAWWSFLQDINSLSVENKVFYYFFNVNKCTIVSMKGPFNYESVLKMLGISLLDILGIVWILSYSLPCINWEVYLNKKKLWWTLRKCSLSSFHVNWLGCKQWNGFCRYYRKSILQLCDIQISVGCLSIFYFHCFQYCLFVLLLAASSNAFSISK